MTPTRPTRSGLGRVIEVDSVEQLRDLVSAGAGSAAGWRLQDLDLRGQETLFEGLDVTGTLVLGGELTPALGNDLRARGALVFPEVPDVPFDVYRSTLYTPEELYSGLDAGYESTPDATAYAWSRHDGTDIAATMAMALHDHAIDDALAEEQAGLRLVGVMGGHALLRDSPGYADAARLGWLLARAGWTVVTGGGPGAMEAANLGGRAAEGDESDVRRALARLTEAPDFRPSVTDWARAAFAATAELPEPTVNLGIPTWHYGHEPPNPFATHVAKYFRNALREDTLLTLGRGGIVFLPGAAGTLQEVFQDACENFYAAPGARAPMVLVGRHHWTSEVPAWPVLEALGRDRGFDQVIHLVDSVDEAADLLGQA